MSSTESEDLSNSASQKKRKVTSRACDHCKRRKIRCGEPIPPYDQCPNCIEHGIECKYTSEHKKRGRPKGYVEGLEKRLRFLEDLVKKLCPDQYKLYGLVSPFDPQYAASLAHIPSSMPLSNLGFPGESASSNTPSSDQSASDSIHDIIHKVASLSLGSKDDPFREDDTEKISLSERILKLSIKPESETSRFWGRSSSAMLIITALFLKNEYWKDSPAERRFLQNRRLSFWTKPSWEKDQSRPAVNYTFPPSDLVPKLIEAYFEHVNLFYPLLHRPTFERDIANGLHLSDEGFGGVLLLVCAVGARYTDEIDERTLSEGTDSHYSAGWQWFNQVQIVRQSLFVPVTLYNLQAYCLAIQFLNGAYAPQAAWILSGFGIRLAQDVGAHRQRIPLEKLTTEDELWKRAFWALVALDRMISMAMGRPCAIFDDTFDVDMPTECDDEYWEPEDPEKRFRQPEGTPSTVSAFNSHLRLYKIMAFAMSTIYSIKTKFWELILREWEQYIVAELDSALNNWLSSLPECLRWDPDRADDTFFKLSANLITNFYHVQILVHRPYITSKGQPLKLPSLAICTSAARSCSQVIEHQMKRMVGGVVYPYMQICGAAAAIVLLLNLWSSKRAAAESTLAMRQVEKCLNALRKAEKRWRSSGIYLDIMNDLMAAGQVIITDEALINTDRDNNSTTYTTASTDTTRPMPFPSELTNQSHQLTHNMYHPTGVQDVQQPQEYIYGGVLYDNSGTSVLGIIGDNTPQTYDTYFHGPLAYGPSTSTTNTEVDLGHLQTNLEPTTDVPFGIADNYELNEWNRFFSNFMELTNELQSESQHGGSLTQQSFRMY